MGQACKKVIAEFQRHLRLSVVWRTNLEVPPNTALVLAHGGALPIHIRLGVNGLAGSWWPQGRYDFGDEGHAAVEESYEYQATLTSVASEALQQVAVDAFNGLAAVYGIEAHSFEQIVALSR